jgi:hypothetical protein
MTVYVPAVYKCRKHDLDLTADVLARVSATPQLVPNVGQRIAAPPAPQPFRVMVHCPGSEGQDDDHDLVFPGTLHP